MGFETLHHEELPAKKARSAHPKERQNEWNLIRHALMTRAPEGAAAWAERYADRFGALFDADEAFHDLVRRAHFENDPKILTDIQDRLDGAG